MKRYLGGERISPGIYWSLKSGEFFQSPTQGVVLPGGAERHYIRVSSILVLVVGPLMGLGYVIFLPMVGIVGVLSLLARLLVQLARRTMGEAAQVTVPNWVPGVSTLVHGRRRGGRRTQKAEKPPTTNEMEELLKDLEKEIGERRRKGEK